MRDGLMDGIGEGTMEMRDRRAVVILQYIISHSEGEGERDAYTQKTAIQFNILILSIGV
jgi:hypothetical protein